MPAGANALVPNVAVSRTGYERKRFDRIIMQKVSKLDWGLYYRPFENDFEISYIGKVGTGSTIYQGINRYAINNFFQEQHKLEVKNDNFYVRGYVVSDDAGDSYDMVFTGININRAWKDDKTWFGEYAGTYVQSTLGRCYRCTSDMPMQELLPIPVAFYQVLLDFKVLTIKYQRS